MITQNRILDHVKHPDEAFWENRYRFLAIKASL